VDGAAQRLRAAFDMHDHGLRLPVELRGAMRAAERHHLTGRRDHLRNRPAQRASFRDRLDQRWMVAAEICEQVRHARIHQRLKQGGAGAVHWCLPSVVSSLAGLSLITPKLSVSVAHEAGIDPGFI